MINNIKAEVVYFAGRREFMSMNIPVILSDQSVDSLILIENCRNNQDREWIANIDNNIDSPFKNKIRVVKKPNEDGYAFAYKSVFTNENVIYIKFDDDIPYLNRNAISKLVEARLKYPKAKLIYPNITNNTIIDMMHQNNITSKNIALFQHPTLDNYITANSIWKSVQHAYNSHMDLINGKRNIEKDDIKVPKYYSHSSFLKPAKNQSTDIFWTQFSINCICFFGKDMIEWVKEAGDTIKNDEGYLTQRIYPNEDDHNMVINNSVIAHYGYFTQKYSNEQRKQIINGYRQMLLKEYPEINFKFEKI